MLNAKFRVACVLLLVGVLAGIAPSAGRADEKSKESKNDQATEEPKFTSLRLRPGLNAGSSPLDLVRRSSIQTELKLNDEQLFQVREVFKANRPRKFDREKFKNLSKEEAAKELKAHRQADFVRQKKLEGLVIQILDTDQTIRLRQLVVQRRGINVFNDPEFVKEISLEGERLKQIRDLISVYKSEQKKFFEDLPNFKPIERKRKAAEYLRSIPTRERTLSEKIVLAMTTEQREKFQELRGERYEFLR